MSSQLDPPNDESLSCYIPLSFAQRWPEGIDLFDEESCRYFLNEIGRRIVPCYPFAFGIEEVYAVIIERYGLDQAPDVMNILQELLEDDQNACGFGDDGDIWRSWRHSWRHRNDNAATPFIPRVGNIILQPPTSTHLRRWKADNFVRQQQLKQSWPDADLCRETTDLGWDVLNEIDIFRGARSPDDQSPVSEHNGDSDTSRALRNPVPVVSCTSLSQFPVPPSTFPCANDALKVVYHETKSRSAGPVPSEQTHHTNRIITRVTGDHNRNSVSQPPTRLENRQARLIDGKIFTPEAKRPSNLVDARDNTHGEVVRPLHDRRCMPAIHRSRKSWIGGLRHVFRRTATEISPKHSRHQSLPQTSLMSSNEPTAMSSPKSAKRERSVLDVNIDGHFGLDGARDDSSCAHGSVINLNKPLPVSPEGPAQADHECFYGSFPAATPKPLQLTSSASTNSSKLSTKSSKADFHEITHEMLHTNLPSVPDLRLLQEFDVITPQFSQREVDESTTSRSWIAESARDSLPNRMLYCSPAKPPPPLDLRHIRTPTSNDPVKSIPYSHSAPIPKQQPVYVRAPYEHLVNDLNISSQASVERNTNTDWVEGRGRSPAKSKPTKAEVSHETPTGRKKSTRSRSPIKRIFGLSKNESSSVSQEEYSPTPNPACSKKNSIKKWGDRIRYGFLTSDDEQLRNEQLIEDHMDNNSFPTINSTFPISLEPPTQAKLQSEIELYVTVTANRFIMKEAKAGRVTAESVSKFKERWRKLGRPQVVEFHYDQMYQHDLVYANVQTVKFCGDAARDQNQVQSTMAGWRVMAREMSVRTFCSPDSVLRKHLHDAHRVLELLGAPFVTFLAYENMQIKSLQMISQRQRERRQTKRTDGHTRSFSDGARVPSDKTTMYEPEYTAESFQLDKVRLSPSPGPTSRSRREPRKATGAEGAIMSLPLSPSRVRIRPTDHVQAHFDQSKGGTVGKTIHEKPENLLL